MRDARLPMIAAGLATARPANGRARRSTVIVLNACAQQMDASSYSDAKLIPRGLAQNL